jgi:ADP-ribose pyrophosphatase YjhB (NUDIX family)
MSLTDSPEPILPGNFVRQIPAGDDRKRRVCGDCGFIDYHNPKVVVGTLATFEDRVLLCQRAIAPGKRLWTHPAGHLERNETAEQGAIRETLEETRARVSVIELLGVFTAPHKAVVEIIYRARLRSDEIGPTQESLAVRLFRWEDIPWDELAFPSTSWALSRSREPRHTLRLDHPPRLVAVS